jgi:integrase
MDTPGRNNRDFSTGPVWDTKTSRWLVEIRYPDGVRLRKRFRRERDALRAWSGEHTKIENGTWNVRTPNAVTFGAALEMYKAHAKVHVPSYGSYTEPALNVWEAGIPTDTLLARVTPAMIDIVKVKRAEEVKKSSVDRNLQVLRRLFNWCIEQGLAVENPVRRVKFFRADTKRLRYLTEEQFARLLDEADKVTRSRWLRAAIELAVFTGLRRGNLLGLQWDWVDWLNRVVRVPRTKSGKPLAIPLNATAYGALGRLWADRGDSPYVFAHATGANLGQAVRDLKKGFHTAMEHAEIEDFRWHDLRHTFASWLVMRGASLRAVAELLGHQTMQMTMRYAHLSPGFLSTEIGLLDDVGDPKRARKGQRAPKAGRSRSKKRGFAQESGAPCRTRTCDLLVRSQALYPTGLRAHELSTISERTLNPGPLLVDDQVLTGHRQLRLSDHAGRIDLKSRRPWSIATP